ncbi:MAG: tetratricopeptide repeat protein [bacterium]|nr:tetratricopeptide repeat protein [bacterium]
MLKRIQVEREARAYVVIGEWEKAIALYRELLEESEDANIYNLIGDVYVRMSSLNDALPEYLRAIDLYETEGLFENGIAVCKKALRLIPGYTELYFNLAVFYAEIGLLNEAAEAFKHYLQSNSKNRGALKKPVHYRKLISLLSSDPKLKAEVEEYYKKSNFHDNELDSIFSAASDSRADPPTLNLEEQPAPIIENIVTPEYEKAYEPQNTPENVQKPTPSYSEPPPPVKKEPETSIPIKTNIPSPTNTPLKTNVSENISNPTITKSVVPPTKAQDDDKPLDNEKDFQLLLHAMNELKIATTSPQKRDHYKIGLEYKSLGFYDAAIKEFQLSTATQQERLKSLKELGYCFLKKDKPDVAINAFNRALEEENKSNDDYYTLKYGLAVAYETMGYAEKAINAFEEIYLYNIDYLDVRDHLKKLKSTT